MTQPWLEEGRRPLPPPVAVPTSDGSGGGEPGADDEGLAALAAAARAARPEARRVQPAGVPQRVAAAAVDVIALFFLFFLLAFALVFLLTRLRVDLDDGPLFVGLMAAVVLAYAATDVVWAATPGKFFLGLCVARRDGRAATPGRRTTRWAVRNLPLLLLALADAAAALPPPVRGLVGGTIAACLWAAGAVAVALALGLVVAMFPPGFALHDWLTGTSVFLESDVIAGRVAAAPGAAFEPVVMTRDDEPPVSE